jgi:3-isopropylmalate/(R)-2-methylmalate dehydratase small subunit
MSGPAKMQPLRGDAWVFPGLMDIDYDICSYNLVRDLRADTAEALGPYCMVNVDPDFPKRVKKGDFIVAEENMGYGHDHDHACLALIGAGVGGILCESAAPYFLRNSLEHGLPVVELPGVFKTVSQGDPLEIDLATGTFRNVRTGAQLSFMPPPDFILEMIAAGGVYPMLTRMAEEGRLPKRV